MRAISLRTRFLLIVMIGVLAPLAATGFWVIGAAERSAEAQLRDRLAGSLQRLVQDAGSNWMNQRSDILRLAESPSVQAVLSSEHTVLGDDLPDDVASAWRELARSAERAVVLDASGNVRARLGEPDSAGSSANAPLLRVRLPAYDRRSGEQIGVVEAMIRPAALLPLGLILTRTGGSLLAAVDAESGTALLPNSIDSHLLSSDNFQWAGEQWLAVHRVLDEPNMRLSLAAPLEPSLAPFRHAAQRASVALVLAFFGVVLLATLVTRRITGSLERLAGAADAVARGDLDRNIAAEGPDEIRRLGHAFNAMTESLRRTLQQLSHREALAAMGELAASIAHEVRNPLTAIRLDLERAAERLPNGNSAAPLVRRSLGEIDRLDSFVAGALRLASTGRTALETVDVRVPLAAAVAAAEPRFAARDARAEVAATEGPVWVRASAAALEQLLLNLLLNAADALDNGGVAIVRVSRLDGRVEITIQDNGRGIPPDQLARVFEPFHSTKPEGTGLGLAIARRIATALGGDLRLQSVPGTGTMVTLSLAEHVTV